MVKVRLKRVGRKKVPFYHIVVSSSRSPRDGKFIEKIGYYNPLKKCETIKEKFVINMERYDYWIKTGAVASEIVKKAI